MKDPSFPSHCLGPPSGTTPIDGAPKKEVLWEPEKRETAPTPRNPCPGGAVSLIDPGRPGYTARSWGGQTGGTVGIVWTAAIREASVGEEGRAWSGERRPHTAAWADAKGPLPSQNGLSLAPLPPRSVLALLSCREQTGASGGVRASPSPHVRVQVTRPPRRLWITNVRV